jgi:hypothetical protein
MDSSSLIVAATALAAVAALFSALAAWFALSHAKRQSGTLNQLMADLEKRELLRNIANESREALEIGQRVEKLAVETVALRRSLAIHQGGLGSEQQQKFDQEIGELSHQVAAAIQGLNEMFDGEKRTAQYGMQELSEIHSQMSAQRGEVKGLLQDLELRHSGMIAALAPFEEVVASDRPN